MRARLLLPVLLVPLLVGCGPQTMYNSPKMDDLSQEAQSYFDCQWDHLQTLDEGESIPLLKLREVCNFDELALHRQAEVKKYQDTWDD